MHQPLPLPDGGRGRSGAERVRREVHPDLLARACTLPPKTKRTPASKEQERMETVRPGRCAAKTFGLLPIAPGRVQNHGGFASNRVSSLCIADVPASAWLHTTCVKAGFVQRKSRPGTAVYFQAALSLGIYGSSPCRRETCL